MAATEIADLGFRADTGDLSDAKAKLEALVPAAGKAERASAKLEAMFSGVNAASAKLMQAANALVGAADRLTNANTKEAAAVNRAAVANTNKGKASRAAAAAADEAAAASRAAAAAAEKEAAATDAATAAARRRGSVPSIAGGTARPGRGPWGHPSDNDNNPQRPGAGGLSGNSSFNTANIAAQFQDIGVTAAMGMNPLQIALQQGTQLVLVLQMMEKPLAGIITGLKSLVSPLSLIVIGLVAVVAAGLQFVNWTKIAQAGLNLLADTLPYVAQGAAIAGAALAIAFAPAIAAAIWSITTAIASGLLVAIGGLVAAVGAIPIAIGLVIADLIIFRDQWANVLGVDLVGIAKTAVNYIIGAFVGAYHDIEFLWKKFPDVIGAAFIGAVNLAIKAINTMVRAATTALNVLIKGANSISNFVGGGNIIDEFKTDDVFGQVANDAADRLAKAVGERNTQLQKDLTTDYLGAMGTAINNAATYASDKIRKFSAGLGVDAKSKKSKGRHGKTDDEKFADIVNGAERNLATLQAENDAIGLSAEATAKLKYETQLLNEAKQKNIQLSPDQRSQLIGLADDMAKLEVATAKAKEQLDFTKDLFKGFVNDLASGLKDGESFWKSFGDAALNALDKIIDKLLNDVINALFEVQSAGSGGSGGGGILGSILGLFGGGGGGGFSAWDYSMADLGVGLFAKGGAFGGGISGHSNTVVKSPTMFAFASGAGLMGEAGPEAVMPLTRMGNGDLGVAVSNPSQSAPQGPSDVNININLKGANGDKEIQQLIADGVQTGLEKFNDDVMPIRVNEIVNDPKVR